MGDLCAYIQIDTVVPEKEEFEFLRDRKFRVRTIKLRKQISQGLIVPVPKGKWSEGNDVTEVLGVKKYEKPDNNPGGGKPERIPKIWYRKYIYLFKHRILYRFFPKLKPLKTSPFPSELVSKTDEDRIQNNPGILTKYKGKKFVVSFKLDGSSITLIHEKKKGKSKVRICSRNLELHTSDNAWHRVYAETDFERHILSLVEYFNTNNVIVQGECIGSFNGNHHGLEKDEIRLFNIIVDGVRIKQDVLAIVCIKLNIPYCPIYHIIELDHDMQEILAISEIKDSINPSVEAEGLVWRCLEDNLSFKVINNKYLLTEA